MKLNALSMSLGLAALVAAVLPTKAADWNYGAPSLKGSVATAVPVPAPVPIPEYAARYYFRADAGFGFGDAPDANENGLVFGTDSATGSFSPTAGWLTSDFESFVTLGAGVGMYIGNGFRFDVTAETRSQAKIKQSGSYVYANNGGTRQYQGSLDDETTLRGGLFLANAYYDFNRGAQTTLTPYVGGGIGFAWTELKRNLGVTQDARDCNPACGNFFDTDDVNSQDKTHDISFAAMATAGMAYRMNDWATLDLNYRFVYIDGVSQTVGVSGSTFGGTSRISIDAMHEHQIRAGIRMDVF